MTLSLPSHHVLCYHYPGFSLTLGLVAFFLATVAFLDASVPWTIGNLVFGFAAFINFQKHRDFKLFQLLRSLLQSSLGSWIFYGVTPIVIFAFLLSKDLGMETLSGSAFSYTGAYLLAIIFLSMKLGVWGPLSHEAMAYLLGVLSWDVLLLAGACIDKNLPFGVLESYALLLDAFTFYLVKSKPLPSPQLHI